VVTFATAFFLLILPFTSSAAWRNIVLGVAVLCCIVLAWRERAGLPRIPRAVAFSFLAWASWCVASWFWSIDPAYTLRELRHEILRPALVFGVFFLAAEHRTYRLWTASLMAGVMLLALLAAAQLMHTGTWNPGRWHAGVGPFSTWLLMMLPLALALALPADARLFEPGRTRWLILGLLLASITGCAFLTMNRIVWPAFAVALGTFLALYLIVRWRHGRERWRLLALGGLLLAAQMTIFGVVATDKARVYHPDAQTVQGALAEDARVKLWPYVADRVAEAPLAGHGFGRGILRLDLEHSLNDETLWHAHNVALNALVETGAVGLAALVALTLALAWRYLVYVRTGRMECAAFGIIGLSFLAGFLVKNMTDDFLIRHTGLLFWSVNGMLIGMGERMLRERSAPPKSDFGNGVQDFRLDQ
jgi:O-antigen ligase